MAPIAYKSIAAPAQTSDLATSQTYAVQVKDTVGGVRGAGPNNWNYEKHFTSLANSLATPNEVSTLTIQ